MDRLDTTRICAEPESRRTFFRKAAKVVGSLAAVGVLGRASSRDVAADYITCGTCNYCIAPVCKSGSLLYNRHYKCYDAALGHCSGFCYDEGPIGSC